MAERLETIMAVGRTNPRIVHPAKREARVSELGHRQIDADTARTCLIDDLVNAPTVIVKDIQSYAMVVVPGRHWLKLKVMTEELGREFELAEETEINKLFSDCQSGAIPPLGPAYKMETFMDQRLLTLANVFFEAGDHEHLVHLDGEAFRTLLKGVRHGYFSHNND